MVSKSNIQEANKHLHAMHLHSTYLESGLQECKEIIKHNEEQYCTQIQNLRKEKDDKIKELSETIKHMDQERKNTERTLMEKENEIRLLRGRLSVFKQIFEFLPGLRSFVGVIENARQLVKEDPQKDLDIGDIPSNPAIKKLNMTVSSIARHNLPNDKHRNLSLSDDSDNEIPEKYNENKLKPNGVIKTVKENKPNLDDISGEVFL